MHVPSGDNPADCASRGLHPHELVDFKLWWCGPHWLLQSEKNWPSQEQPSNLRTAKEVILEERTTLLVVLKNRVTNDWLNSLLSRCSTHMKVVNVVARIMWLFKKRNPVKPKSVETRQSSISTDVINEARKFIIKCVQSEEFGREIDELNRQKPINNKSKLKSLYPILDHDGVLRVGGRLQNADIPFEVKHPIIIPSQHRLTTLIVRGGHIRQLHAGPTLLMSILNQKYYVIRCKNEVRVVVGRCVKCLRLKAQHQQQLMGQLPISRVSYQRAFMDTGIDYAGPLRIKVSRLRGAKVIKCYLALFVCMGTKALHLELVSDMTTDAFLAALRRFQSRRGICVNIYSDNGSNFVGANNELQRILKAIMKDELLMNYARSFNIKWNFNPPAAPHFGGIWEAAVKSTKYHLKRVLGETLLTFEEMVTLLTQIEGILNSRPLCEIDKDHLDPLTPSHFLIG